MSLNLSNGSMSYSNQSSPGGKTSKQLNSSEKKPRRPSGASATANTAGASIHAASSGGFKIEGRILTEAREPTN